MPGGTAVEAAAIEAAVLAAEKRRCDAMLADDADALGAVLDPLLHFAHATGAVDDRDTVLAKVAAGRIRYRSIDWSEARVIPLGADSALLVGRMATRVVVEGVEKDLANRVLLAWARSEGAWRAVAFQSTPIRS